MKSECKDDFFFGKYINEISGEAVVNLREMLECAEKSSPEFFTGQLNRFIQENNSKVVLSHGTSTPSFSKLLDKILSNQIGYIEISRRTDINSCVDATLDCSIFLERGILVLEAHWNTRNTFNGGEMISSLLVPLHVRGLSQRTYLNWGDGKKTALMNVNGYHEELRDVFELSSYSLYEEFEPVDDYVAKLSLATEVSRSGLVGKEAHKSYHKQRRDMIDSAVID